MMKKIALTANLIIGLAAFTTANATSVCFDLSLDDSSGPSILRPAFTPQECDSVKNRLQSSGMFPNIFTLQGENLLLNDLDMPLCFISNRKDPYNLTNGVHALMGNRKVVIDSSSIWTNQFKPNLPKFGLNGLDTQASVITQWTVTDYLTNKTIGKGFTTDLVDTKSLLELGTTSELDVIIGGTDKLSTASGSIRVNSSLINEYELPIITSITGKLCISQ